MRSYYLQPHIEDGKTTGGFHLIRAAGSKSGRSRVNHQRAVAGLIVAVAVSILLWGLIALAIF